MQVTELQVQRSLQALTDSRRRDETDADRLASCAPTVSPTVSSSGWPRLAAVRDDRLAEARERLETGEHPSADDLAGRMVGRLVCDRLR